MNAKGRYVRLGFVSEIDEREGEGVLMELYDSRWLSLSFSCSISLPVLR